MVGNRLYGSQVFFPEVSFKWRWWCFITIRRALWKAERPPSRLQFPQCCEGEPSGYTNKNWPRFYRWRQFQVHNVTEYFLIPFACCKQPGHNALHIFSSRGLSQCVMITSRVFCHFSIRALKQCFFSSV